MRSIRFLRAAFSLLLLSASIAVPKAEAAGTAQRMPQAAAVQQCLPPVVSTWHFSEYTVSHRRSFVATISVICRPNVPFTLSLSSASECRMHHGADWIFYSVYEDAGHRRPILPCDGATGAPAFSGTGSHMFVVYGDAIVYDQQLAVGDYDDTINVILSYGS